MKTFIFLILFIRTAYSQFDFSNGTNQVVPPKLSYEENKRHINQSFTQDQIANELLNATIQNSFGHNLNEPVSNRLKNVVERYNLNLQENQEVFNQILMKAGINSIYPDSSGPVGNSIGPNVTNSMLSNLVDHFESMGVVLPAGFETLKELSYLNLTEANEQNLFEKISQLPPNMQMSTINKVAMNFYKSDTFIENTINLQIENNLIDRAHLKKLLDKLLNQHLLNPTDKKLLLIQLILDHVDIDSNAPLYGNSASLMCNRLQDAIAFRDGDGKYRDMAIHGDAYNDQLIQYVEYLNLLVSYDSDLNQTCENGITAIDLISELSETNFLDFTGTYLGSVLSGNSSRCYNSYVGLEVADFCLNMSVVDKIFEILAENNEDINKRPVSKDITYVTNDKIGECSISLHNSMIRKANSSDTYSLYMNVISPYHHEEIELSSESVESFILKFKKILKKN